MRIKTHAWRLVKAADIYSRVTGWCIQFENNHKSLGASDIDNNLKYFVENKRQAALRSLSECIPHILKLAPYIVSKRKSYILIKAENATYAFVERFALSFP